MPTVIHGLEDARDVLRQAKAEGSIELTLHSAPLAAAHGGALWFKTILEKISQDAAPITVTGILDCGDQPGLVLEALYTGLKNVRVSSNIPALPVLQDLARQHNALLTIEDVPEVIHTRSQSP